MTAQTHSFREPKDSEPAGTIATQNRRLVTQHFAFRIVWGIVNILLAIACIFALYASVWEYSTKRYLTGFSNAIVPTSSSDEDKIMAILSWMNFGPTRLPYNLADKSHDRDPTDTLNYDALLKVCGTATNAFINLAETSHLKVRRLLLLDENQITKHVVAEVLVDRRWIIVDPAYRVIFRDRNGLTVTSKDLLAAETFRDVTSGIRNYLPEYSFENTAHVRVNAVPFVGRPVSLVLNRMLPGWEASTFVSLVVERESLADEVTAILLVIFLLLLRFNLRWYAERRLKFSPVHLRDRAKFAWNAFIRTPG
jgi:hypothetical protein